MSKTPGIKVDLTVNTSRVNKFIEADNDSITIESTISRNYLAYALKEHKIAIEPDGLGFTWLSKENQAAAKAADVA